MCSEFPSLTLAVSISLGFLSPLTFCSKMKCVTVFLQDILPHPCIKKCLMGGGVGGSLSTTVICSEEVVWIPPAVLPLWGSSVLFHIVWPT